MAAILLSTHRDSDGHAIDKLKCLIEYSERLGTNEEITQHSGAGHYPGFEALCSTLTVRCKMDSATAFLLAADLILLLHVLIVAYVVMGLVLIFIGKARSWSWVRNPWFRLIHLVVIGIVIVQSWFGAVCPLTTIEMALRSRAGDTVYTGSFIAHWLENILYYQAPPWFFIICYLIVGALTFASWFWIRPRGFRKSANHHTSRQSIDPDC